MRNACLVSISVLLCLAGRAQAQYNDVAAKSAPMEVAEEEVRRADGTVEKRRVERAPARDGYGNAAGNRFDLAVDGAFEGQTVAVLHFYTGEGFDFSLPRAALAEKGFSVYRWINAAPSPKELREGLAKASQLWIISGSARRLDDEHIAVIKDFFESGRGVYIWGDNDPYYADANAVAEALLGARMSGNLIGNKVVQLQDKPDKAGVVPDHLLTTGLEHIFEGITIATIDPGRDLKPLIYGSADNMVAAYYDRDGKRAILDGGFTRLYLKWDTAGTARYVKNAAAWLANAERFKEVVAEKLRKPAVPAVVAPQPPIPEVTPTPAPVPAPTPAPAAVAPAARTTDLVGRWALLGIGVGLVVVLAYVRKGRDQRDAR